MSSNVKKQPFRWHNPEKDVIKRTKTHTHAWVHIEHKKGDLSSFLTKSQRIKEDEIEEFPLNDE